MGRRPKSAMLDNVPSRLLSNEVINNEPKTEECPTRMQRRKAPPIGERVAVRRSGRIQNLPRNTQSQDIQRVAEEIDLVESEREEEPQVEQCIPEANRGSRDLVEKLDIVIQAVEEIKTMATKRHPQSGISNTDLNYKSLYIESQEKIEALTTEKHQLVLQLQFISGKLEAYEKMNGPAGNWKELVMASNKAKSTEKMMSMLRDEISNPDAVAHGPSDPIPFLSDAHVPAASKLRSPPTKKRKLTKCV